MFKILSLGPVFWALFVSLTISFFLTDTHSASAQDFVKEAHQECNPTEPIEAAQLPSCEIDAASGNADAETVICALYHSGTFLKQDFTNAAAWCLKAAKQGRITAQVMLGRIYAKGEGVPRDNTEAYAWFSVAANTDALNRFTLLAKAGRAVLTASMTNAEKQQAQEKASAYTEKYSQHH